MGILTDTTLRDTGEKFKEVTGTTVGTKRGIDVNVIGSVGSGGGGDATAANQVTIIGHVDGIEALLTTIDADTSIIAGTDFATQTTLASILSDTTSLVGKDFATQTTLANINSNITVCDTSNITVSSSALPTGAATSALQTSSEALLTSIDADTGNIATNTSTIAGETTSLDGKFTAASSLADNISTPTTTQVGAMLYGWQESGSNWDRARMIGDNADGIGTASTGHIQVMSHGMYFNGSTWDRFRGDLTDGLLVNLGSNNDVSVSSSALPTGAATETTLLTIDTDTGNIASSTSTIAGAVSGSEMQVDVITMPTVTTSESKSSTATHSNVAGSATSVTLLASNANRLGATIYNDSTATLYVKLAATASTTSFTTKLFSDDYYELPFGYTGIIDGIWASATGSARVVEMTA